MFSDTFSFYKGYSIPQCRTVDQFKEAIEQLPLVDSPEAFGLHPNADITYAVQYIIHILHLLTYNILYRYQSNMAKEILDTIMSIQPKDSSGGGGETRESVVGRQASDMLEKLPPDYIPHEVKSRLVKMGAMSSMNIFLRQEIDRMQRVISLVRTTLVDLQLAIEGTIIMSEV